MELSNKRIVYDVTHDFEDYTIHGEAIYSMTNEFARFNGNVNNSQGVTIGSIFYNIEDDDNINMQFNVKEDLIDSLVGVATDLINQLKNIEV